MWQKFPQILKRILAPVLLLLLSFSATASHIVGIDLYYTWVSGNTYKITLVAYGDCGIASEAAFNTLHSANPKICIYNGGAYITSINLTIEPPSNGVEITPVCPSEINNTQCTNGASAIPGIKKFVYSGNYTVPATSAQWRFVFYGYMGGASGAGRAAAITNITSGSVIELVDTLNNTVLPNSSPILTVVPTPFFCLNNNDNYNPGAVDVNGDSLNFQLVAAKGGLPPPGSGVLPDCMSSGAPSYISPYTPTAPLAASSFSFDQNTGQIVFYPNALQRSLVVYNVREFRNGVLVGTSQREMTFLVLTCTNPGPIAPLASTNNGIIVDSTHFKICRNSGDFDIDIFPTETATTNNITVTSSGLPAGAVLNVTGNGTPTPHVVISWTSNSIAPGNYIFYLTYTDDNCPLASVQTIAYTITVLPAPTVSVSVVSLATCLRKAYINISTSGTASAPVTVLVSRPPTDTFQTFPGVFGTLGDSLVPGTYTITVRNPTTGCMASFPINIPFPTPPAISATKTDPTYCGLNDGTITISGLVAGSSNSIAWDLYGVTQPSVIRVASSSGTVTLTGLTGGIYTNIYVTYGNCIAGPAGPLTLVNPPVPPISVTFTNPTYCGHNDGTIKIYHLHPGFTDTIRFNRDGIPQPPVILVVAADSTVTVTGLYAGTYSNIRALFGACASDLVGPVTLINPTPPTPTVTFTNPSYCGHLDGSITIGNLHAGDADTIRYYLNSVLQPPRYITVSSSGTAVITGLGVGIYSNITVTFGPCVTPPLGPLTLTTPPVPTPTITFTNPSYCGHYDGSITIGNLHPGDADTITYTLNGVAQPPRHLTVSASGTVVLTGLGAGVYASIIAVFGPCSTSALTATLVNPPILVPTGSFTNPSYCGHFDGTITINNLHPGDVDTVRFFKDGVLQPLISILVPASGTVVITGLGAGVYTNIVVSFGPCSTTPLGPITLTNPPLLVPTATYTSPTYCAARNGTITISNLYPGDADTIRYMLNGVWQTPVVLTVSPGGVVVMTGLDQGTYSDISAWFNGCNTSSVGPFTLVNPPFTLRNVTYSNPTKCGFCDGKLTFYGLHPAQVDTIRYTLNGVTQPLVSVSVPADSTVVVPNLCEGTYNNIVVNTTAACVSGTFGPHILVAPPIIPGFNFTFSKHCSGDTLVCTNTSSPASDLTYTWNFGDGATSTLTNPTHVYTAPGVYAIKLVITNTRCIDSITHTVNADNLVIADFSAMPDSFLCIGKPVTFTNNSAGTGLIYTWIFGDGTTSTATNVVYTYTTTGIYDVALAVTNAAPCFDTAKKRLEVDPISGVTVSVTDSVLCKGGAITFNGIYDMQGNTGVVWTFSSTDSIRDVNPVLHAYEDPGTYTVTIKALYRACPDTTAKAHIYVVPYPFIDLGPDTSICPGAPAPVTITDARNINTPGARWLWNTGATTPSINVAEPGTYRATINIGGCETSDDVVVENDCYINIPNIFTPNGDGVNDYFLPRDLLSRGLTEFRMAIYNRWGEVIFETRSVEGRGWDGRYNDIPQPQGVFIYTIDATFKDGQKEHHQGNLTLMR